MRKYYIFIPILLIIIFTTTTGYADCRGCCARHGGVVCIDGITKCRDGSLLSQKCIAKGCNKCGSLPHAATLSTPPVATSNSHKSIKIIVHPKPSGSFRCNGHVAYGIPGPEDQLLCREGYAVGYDYKLKDPIWVAYHLTPESVNKKYKRSNKFKKDTEVPVQYRSTLSDYRRSGYDRGHMAASATVDSSYNAMMESFLLSNMTPQLPGFNRRGWKYLEEYVREWTNERGELYVVTGAIFKNPHKIIGNGVHVPSHFFKVIYDPVDQDAIAFLIPHRPISKSELPGFIVSVDKVEQITGLDFNNLLPDELENDIEDNVDQMW